MMSCALYSLIIFPHYIESSLDFLNLETPVIQLLYTFFENVFYSFHFVLSGYPE